MLWCSAAESKARGKEGNNSSSRSQPSSFPGDNRPLGKSSGSRSQPLSSKASSWPWLGSCPSSCECVPMLET